ncbi:LOW QUALITY PROTEIN: hypothetical protein PanWU01x14_012490, partial [Parasponia andersonii]
ELRFPPDFTNSPSSKFFLKYTLVFIKEAPLCFQFNPWHENLHKPTQIRNQINFLAKLINFLQSHPYGYSNSLVVD